MHKGFLQQALEYAKIRRGFCAPNPSVGAIVVKNDHVIAAGYHFAAGHPHAEVEALQRVVGCAHNAIVYVTLEPCCHWGKTAPCTELLIGQQVKQVIFGYIDPNSEVAGKGVYQLKAAGIACEQLPLPEITSFYESYAFWVKHQRPFVTAKLAMSLDGKIALQYGKPVKITGGAAEQFTHQGRLASDAILTTVRTINNDNPRLNARIDNNIIAKPVYLIDRTLSLHLDAQILLTAQQLTVFHSHAVDQNKIAFCTEKGIRCIAVSENEQGLNLVEILQQIGKDGKHDLWIEAGGFLFQQLATQHLLQRAYIYVAPRWLGSSALAAFGDGEGVFAQAKSISWRSLGGDGICQIDW